MEVQLVCSDADGDALFLAAVDQPDNGTLGVIDQVTDRVTYTPEAGFIGTVIFHYDAFDGQAHSGAAMVTIEVTNSPPTAEFGFSPTTPDAGEEVTFTSTSIDPDGDVDTLEWDLDGDGQYDDGAGSQVATTFTDGGTHAVGLKATDTNGATDTVEHDVFVRPPPVCAPVSAEVQRTRLLEITLPCTDDDALTLEILNGGPQHGGVESIDPGNLRVSYRAPSQYLGSDDFTYRVSDGVSSTEAAVSLTVVNHPPAGDFLYSPAAPEARQTITFFAAGQDPDGSIAAYAWDLDGDGQFDDGAGEEASHVFSWGGTYTVRLRVTDGDGENAIVEHAIAVAGDPPPSATPTPGGGTGPGAGGAPGSGTGRPPGAGGAADRTAPTVSARVGRQPLDTVRSKGLALTLVASEACSVTVTLELDKATARRLKLERRPKGSVVVGTVQQTLLGPQATARVKLTAKARKALRRVRSVKLRIAIAATDSAGNTATIAVKPLTVRE